MSSTLSRCSALLLVAVAASAQMPRVEAGVQVGALDERDTLGEKPAIAGGRISVRTWRFFDVEAEVDRLPIGGGSAAVPATEVLVGARAGYRSGPLALFATVRPGFLRFDSASLNAPSLGTRPAVDLGVALGWYLRRHVFVRFDAGDLVLGYGEAGTHHHFQGTLGFGVWF